MKKYLLLLMNIVIVFFGVIDSNAKRINDTHYELCIMDAELIIDVAATNSWNDRTFKSDVEWECHNDFGYYNDPTYYDETGIRACFNTPYDDSYTNLSHRWNYYSGTLRQAETKFVIKVLTPSSVSISGLSEEYTVGDNGDFSVELGGDFPDFEYGGYFAYEFKSSNENVLNVEQSVLSQNQCYYKTLSSGETTVTVDVYARNKYFKEAGEYHVGQAKVEVKVKANEPKSIEISPDELTLGINETRKLDCIILPSEAPQEVTWESDDPTVATVSSTGKVTGKKVGTTTITAKTSNGLTSTCKVTVAKRYLIDGIQYEIDDLGGYALVCPLSSGEKYKGDIVVPKKVSIDGESYYVEDIGENAFRECTELNSIILPEGIASIDSFAFYGCTSLSSMRLNKVQSIRQSAFEGCTGLNVIQLLLWPLEENRNSYLHEDAFKGCNNLKKVYIDNMNSWVNVKIYGNATGNPLCPAKAELYLNGEKVVNLTVPVPKSKELGFAAFLNCSSIESVSFQHGIERIGGRAFQDCDNLKIVNLPSSLREIEGYAFAWCDNITTVNCYATTPPDMQTGWNDYDFNDYFAFYKSSPQEITLHVPKGCMQAYASAPGWNLFSVIIDDLDSNAGVNDVQEDKPDYSTENVYNLQGILIKNNATAADIESLPAGLYIIGGKKVVVK